jgi:hypothetical protein
MYAAWKNHFETVSSSHPIAFYQFGKISFPRTRGEDDLKTVKEVCVLDFDSLVILPVPIFLFLSL